MADQYEMQDPLAQYPQLAIPEQRQSEPGLDASLEPRADHGQDSYVGHGRLKGRKALITGGDSGIGRAVAIAYAREGADVAIGYLPAEQDDADETKQLIEAAGQKAVLLPGDLSDERYARALVNDAAKELGGLDILVNNAGKQLYVEDFTKLETKQIVDTFTVNVVAMYWTIQEALKYLPKGGTIINTTSIQAYQPSAGLWDYAATKAAIANLTHNLGAALIEKGIRVNGVAPGPIWTPLQPSYGQPMEKLTKFGEQSAYGRAGQPAELAPAYVFLASQESSYSTGEIIGVTGGQFLP